MPIQYCVPVTARSLNRVSRAPKPAVNARGCAFDLAYFFGGFFAVALSAAA